MQNLSSSHRLHHKRADWPFLGELKRSTRSLTALALSGVDWPAVESATDVCKGYQHFLNPMQPVDKDGPNWWDKVWHCLSCHKQRERRKMRGAHPSRKLLGEGNGLGGPHFFGRARGWGENSQDIETGFFEDGKQGKLTEVDALANADQVKVRYSAMHNES